MIHMPEPHPDDDTLSGFLEWIATSYSSRPALLYKPSLKTEIWTYADLREQAYRVTRWLQDQGVGKGERIVLWAPNSPW
ncbi:MAG TPA: AMP-binding protein, partial [Chloroflexota bacterium]